MASLEAALSAETAARQAADTTLQNNIDVEAGVRAAGDGTLDTRLDILEGNISSTDLAGTYTMVGIQTRLGGTPDIRVGVAAETGTMTLNQDGTGSLQITNDGPS